MSEAKLRRIFFVAISLVTWLLYFKTTAPTVVFWDVGEFLATSYILGIPHPPGTPLYVILGKFMTLLPLPMASLFKLLSGGDPVEPVLRITLISITSGALSAGLVYLLTVKVIERWLRNRKKDETKNIPKLLPHLAGLAGAILAVTAKTVWMNSIEAEVYTPSTFIILFVSWVAFNWWEHLKDPKSIRYILFALYVLFLSSGIHLMPLIIFPVLFVFVLVVHPRLLLDWEFLLMAALMFMWISVAQLTYKPLVGEPTGRVKFLAIVSIAAAVFYHWIRGYFQDALEDPVEIAFFVGALGFVVGALSLTNWAMILGALLVFVTSYIKGKFYTNWKGFALLLIFLGVSVELYMIIRAHHNPSINETDPQTWKAFMDALLRKQYEPAKIFPRRIPWGDQFRVYWLYLTWQYSFPILLFLLLFAIFGFVVHAIEDTKSWVLIGGGLIIASLGILVYLNLKDSPTHPVNPYNPTEVRDRDYFYAVSYVYLGLFAGLGLFEAALLLYEFLKSKLAMFIAPLFGMALGVAHVAQTYPIVDRSENYIAEDYAYDLLISPAPNAVMYTNGDNDTFPLWFDQEVLGVRTDVKIANLSLLSTNWYVKQLKLKGAPISFPLELIDSIPPAFAVDWSGPPSQQSPFGGNYILLADFMVRDMIATSLGYKTDNMVRLRNGLEFPKIYLASQKEFLDSVIAQGGEFKVPIYFALTVSHDHYAGWENYLEMEGMALALRTHPVRSFSGSDGINLQKTSYLLHGPIRPQEYVAKYSDTKPPWDDVFRYRGVFNPKVYKDETHEKMVRNCASVAFRVGIEYESTARMLMAMNDTARAESLYRLAIDEFWFGQEFLKNLSEESREKLAPQINAVNAEIANIYLGLNEIDSAKAYINKITDIEGDPRALSILSDIYLTAGDTDSAIVQLEKILSINPFPDVYAKLIGLYVDLGDTAKARQLLREAEQRGAQVPLPPELQWLKTPSKSTLIGSLSQNVESIEMGGE